MNQAPQPNPDNSNDIGISENLGLLRKETREKYPTPLSVVDDYRNGIVNRGVLDVAFTPEEIEEIEKESGQRNSAEAQA